MQIPRCGEHRQLPVTSNGMVTLDAGPEVLPELCMPALLPPPSLPPLHMYLLPLIAAPASLICHFVQFRSPVAPLAPLIPLHFVLFTNHANHTNCAPCSPSCVSIATRRNSRLACSSFLSPTTPLIPIRSRAFTLFFPFFIVISSFLSYIATLLLLPANYPLRPNYL